MGTDKPESPMSPIDESRRVLDDAVAGPRDLGYRAEAANRFDDVATRCAPSEIDLVVFEGQVSDRRAEPREEIGAINPQIVFVQGLAGISRLTIDQARGAFAANNRRFAEAPALTRDERSIWLRLGVPADVEETVRWQTSPVPPDPPSDSLAPRGQARRWRPHGYRPRPCPDHGRVRRRARRRPDPPAQHRGGPGQRSPVVTEATDKGVT